MHVQPLLYARRSRQFNISCGRDIGRFIGSTDCARRRSAVRIGAVANAGVTLYPDVHAVGYVNNTIGNFYALQTPTVHSIYAERADVPGIAIDTTAAQTITLTYQTTGIGAATIYVQSQFLLLYSS